MSVKKKTKKKHVFRGFAVLDLVITVSVFFLIVLGFQVLFSRSQAESRDLRRLADMREVETVFEKLFLATGGYGAASSASGCHAAGSLVSTCDFSRVNLSLAGVRDPGSSSYRVTIVPDETTYEISFSLERSHTGITAGKHILTPQGIR